VIKNFIKELKVGGVVIKNNLIMAPMAGITDLPFRVLAKEGGAGLVCTEMVSANGLSHNDFKTKKLAGISKEESPVSVQIFGSTPEALAEAAQIVEQNNADIIDINLGCPAPKIRKAGAGFKLVENEELLVACMKAVVHAVKKPVTVKMRIGKESGDNVAPHLARLAQDCGVEMVVVHGRPAVNMHSGEVDLQAIEAVVKAVSIPVIANGAIKDELSATIAFESTGCAGLMLGRGAIGDPSLFGRLVSYFENGDTQKPPTWEERLIMFRRHVALACTRYGEKNAMMRMRKVAPYYIKDMPGATRLRALYNTFTELKQLDNIEDSLKTSSYFETQTD
jgi:tRNA-dihydrouridine synthase B